MKRPLLQNSSRTVFLVATVVAVALHVHIIHQPPLSRCSKVLKGRAQHLVRLMLTHTLHVCVWVCRHI